MNTREKFGNYVLLKKLAEDALGETFRAGRFGNEGIEQVVLLRIFDAPGLDAAALWQRVSQRGAVQSGLLSPSLGNGIDFGELQGVPYVVYDYVSGTNLAALMAAAESQYSPIPVDHALLIMERIALGLSAAYESRYQGSRILHGFLVPELVMVSNEGEARLLGFEVSSGLRELAAQNPSLRAFERYLAPETLAGSPPDKADDVYSLGVLLYELLTGKAFAPGTGGVATLLSEARLADGGESLPAPVAQLLQKSLAPRESRFSDSAAWHKILSQLMIDQQYNPTTFNLAFFMHNLFREEIEKESREIQAEKNLEDAGDTLEVAAAPAASGDAVGAETLLVSQSELTAAEPPEEATSRKGLLAAIAALIAIAVLGGLGYWFFVLRAAPEAELEPPPVAAAPVDPEPVAPAGPSQEEIQAELERMRLEMAEALAAQSEEMKQTLASQYEGKIKELQQQYDESQQEAAARRKREQEEALAAQQAAITAEAQRRAQATKPPPPPAATAPAQQAAAEKAPAEPPAAAPREPEPQVAEAAPPPPPPKPQVRRGQLVEPGPGVKPPKLLRRAQARYPPMARRARREATVTVRVLVDETGKVAQAEPLGRKVGLGIDEAALDAAKASTFTAPTKDGVPVKMWHSLRFDFRP